MNDSGENKRAHCESRELVWVAMGQGESGHTIQAGLGGGFQLSIGLRSMRSRALRLALLIVTSFFSSLPPLAIALHHCGNI